MLLSLRGLNSQSPTPTLVIAEQEGIKHLLIVNTTGVNVYLSEEESNATPNGGYTLPPNAQVQFNPYKGNLYALADIDGTKLVVIKSKELKA